METLKRMRLLKKGNPELSIIREKLAELPDPYPLFNQFKNSEIINFIEGLRHSNKRFGIDGKSISFVVSPNEAKYLLTNYVWNFHRPISKHIVELYMAKIAEGSFDVTGQGLIVGRNSDDDNKPIILDGRHRLTAVANGTKSVRLLFFFHDPFPFEKNLTLFKNMDRVSYRSIQTVLRIAGVVNPGNISKISRPILNYFNKPKSLRTFIGNTLDKNNRAITELQFETFYYHNSDGLLATSDVVDRAKKAGLPSSHIIGSLYFVYKYILGTPGIDEFVNKIITGVKLGQGSIELAYREFLVYYKQNSIFISSPTLSLNVVSNMAFEYFAKYPNEPYNEKITTKSINQYLKRFGIFRNINMKFR